MRYVLKVAYDGTVFAGWQRQRGLPTVAGTLEAALQRLVNAPVSLTAAGRTDRGVHAIAQYAHWESEKPLPFPFLPRLTALLPETIQPLALYQVEPAFHARHAALARHYQYFLGENVPLFWRRYVWEVSPLPPLELLQEAAQLWKGERDFRAFCKGANAYEHTRCQIYESRWCSGSYPNGTRLLIFDIVASRFLHGMVRFLVGAAFRYATGRLSHARLIAALETGDRSWGLHEAPAQGLFLHEVYYPPNALYLLERHGPSSADPFPAPDFAPGAKPAPDSGGSPSGATRSGTGPAH